jgi:hypothetical protein
MKIFWNIFVSETVLATFSKFWANFSKSSGHPACACAHNFFLKKLPPFLQNFLRSNLCLLLCTKLVSFTMTNIYRLTSMAGANQSGL